MTPRACIMDEMHLCPSFGVVLFILHPSSFLYRSWDDIYGADRGRRGAAG
jgi:hypothetical protein